MEKAGLVKCLSTVSDSDLSIGTLVTDRHRQIAKTIREEYPDITHKYDIWHVAKGENNALCKNTNSHT